MLKQLLLGSWLLSAALITGSANAGNYWGLGLGNAAYDLKVLGVVPLKDGTAVKFLWGNRNENIGMEAEFSFSSHDWEGAGGLATHNVGNLVFSGIGYFPVGSGFDVYGKAGLNLWSTTVDLVGTNYDGDSGVGLALGAGLDFATTDRFHLRLEYQMFNGIGDTIDEGDITQVTLSGTYYY